MKKRFEALDAFRGICALCVVMFHMRIAGSVTDLEFFRQSHIFVDFFFVLSGFVLAHGYGFRENLRFGPFMKARFFRLYPLHIFMFLVFVLLECAKLAAYKFGGFVFNEEPFTGSTALREMIPNIFLIQSWTPWTNELSFNYPSWSISIELYVYALLFLTVMAAGRIKVFLWALISALMFALILSGSEVLTESVLTGLSCFFAGAVTYCIYKRIAHLTLPRHIMTLLECVLLGFVIYALSYGFPFYQVFMRLIFCSAVLLFAFEMGSFSRVLKVKPFQVMGRLSYSIYMTHAAILFCLISTAIVWQKVTGIGFTDMGKDGRYLVFGNDWIANVVVLLVLGGVVGVSYFTHKYIELTGQSLGKRLRKKSAVKAMV